MYVNFIYISKYPTLDIQIIMARGRTLCRGPMPSHIDAEPESSPTIGGPMPQPPPSWPSRHIGDNPSPTNNIAIDGQQQTEQLQSEESGGLIYCFIE